MKKIMYLFVITVILCMSVTGYSQKVNINDCSDEALVDVGNKYGEMVGEKFHLYSKVKTKRIVKIHSITLTPFITCDEGTITLTRKTKKPKDMKFYSMNILIRENGTIAMYTIGYQLYLSMLSSEKNRREFSNKLLDDRYKIALDQTKRSLYLISY